MARERGVIAVYIMASRRNGTLYIGVTSALYHRIWQHKSGAFEGFSKKYGCTRLVWFETFERVFNAIHREKQLKRYLRAWKLALIEAENPEWRDLSDDFFEDWKDVAPDAPPSPLLTPSSSDEA
jgi:putative endonuclease